MKEKIYITEQNRDLHPNKKQELWFENEGNNIYTLHCDLNYILNYACTNYEELPEDAVEYDSTFTDQFNKIHKCKNYSFDPAGGPYIAVGSYKIEGKTVKRIFGKDGEIAFEVG